MGKKVIKRGSGITEAYETKYYGEDIPDAIRKDSAALSDRFRRGGDVFEASILEIEEWAILTLKDAGIWGEYQEGQHAHFPHDTPEGYALSFLDYIGQARARIAEGHSATAARCAFKLGRAVSEMLIKQDWEAPALSGQRSREGAALGARAAYGDPKQNRQTYQAEVDEVHRRNPSLSWTRISEIAGKRFGVTGKTVRNHCDNPGRK